MTTHNNRVPQTTAAGSVELPTTVNQPNANNTQQTTPPIDYNRWMTPPINNEFETDGQIKRPVDKTTPAPTTPMIPPTDGGLGQQPAVVETPAGGFPTKQPPKTMPIESAAPADAVQAPQEGPVTRTILPADAPNLAGSAPQESTYIPKSLVETGAGSVYKGAGYSGQSEEAILAASQKGLISMLEEDNPYMQLARKQGARLAESRGLGGSSLRERASQGAAIDSAMPLVQQAGQLASAERQTAMQATAQSQIAAMQTTAQSEIAASNRKLEELMQQEALAVQAGDSAAARQLQSEISNEQNRLTQWQTQSDLASREQMQLDQNQLQLDMQSIDVDYKKWLEDTTFKHQGILQGNQQAAQSFSDFTAASMQIMNNPDTSSSQKQASITALKQTLENSLTAISATADIDLSKFLTPAMNPNDTNPFIDGPFIGPQVNPGFWPGT